MVRLAILAVLALAALVARGQNPPPALWYNAGHVELTANDAAGKLAATWQFDRADNGDIRIIKDEQRDAARASGTVMSVCDDNALLVKGIVPARRHELRELDEPVLYLQLALRLLARALPQGPLAMGPETALDLREGKTPIRVHKGGTVRRDFNAPWQARGRASRDASGMIAFDIVFDYEDGAVAGGRSELKLGGVWRQKSQMSAFDNAQTIADWTVYRVDKVVNFVGGNAQIDALPISQPLHFKTLGELRARIERAWNEGPRARKQMECKL